MEILLWSLFCDKCGNLFLWIVGKKCTRAILWIEIAKWYCFSKMEDEMILLKLKQKNKHRLHTFIVDSGHCYNEEGVWSILELVSSFDTKICVLNDININAFILSKFFLW